MKRRDFLNHTAVLGVLPYLNWADAFMSLGSAAEIQKSKKTLVVIFQRGAADGLSVLSPIGDAYFNQDLRPNIMADRDKMLKLDSYFALHPAMEGFKQLWDRGMLTPIHQVGSPSASRSHFDSQDYMESGTPDLKSTEDGFMARAGHLLKLSPAPKLNSLAVQANIPRMISGDAHTLSFSRLNQFDIKGFKVSDSSTAKAGGQVGFESFFESALDEVLQGHSQDTVSLLGEFEKARKIELKNDFKKGQLANRLGDMAQVIKSGLYIPFMVTEVGGWDTHVNQGSDEGQLASRLKEFSEAITKFVDELGDKMADVTIVTVTEFGRTVKENGSKGTDHGHGSCHFVINGQLKPKNIIADWKDLKAANLYEGRDLPVTTDYRDIFSTVLRSQFGLNDMSQVFPGFKPNPRLKIYRNS